MKLKHEFPAEFYKEEKATFVIDSERKRIWAALLDLLAEFDRVCRKYSLRYSIDGGTMLGKARHNGIIPWDDDIDVIMMRSEYEKLKVVAADEFAEPYFLQTMESDPEALNKHPKLRNSSMTMIERRVFKDGKAIHKSYNQGLFIDIFVLDSIPDDREERRFYFEELSKLQNQVWAASEWRQHKPKLGITPRQALNYWRQRKIWQKHMNVYKKTGVDPIVYYSQEFERGCRRYENARTCEVSHLTFAANPPDKWIFERDKVLEVEDVEFMGLKVMMLKEWKYYLDRLYGDWGKYVVGGTQHGGLVIDLDNPYTEYF